MTTWARRGVEIAERCRAWGIVPDSLLAVTHKERENGAMQYRCRAMIKVSLRESQRSLRSKLKNSHLAEGATATPWVESRPKQKQSQQRHTTTLLATTPRAHARKTAGSEMATIPRMNRPPFQQRTFRLADREVVRRMVALIGNLPVDAVRPLEVVLEDNMWSLYER